MFKKVALAISGGVDSAVAGALLKRRGFEVCGIFMRNWDDGECSADKDKEDAEWVCNKLKIPFYEVNFVKEYWNEVFLYLLDEYQSGSTPNPDIFCSKFIKFHHFLEFAKRKTGAEAIATGHYARSSFGPYLEHFCHNKGASLLKAKDAFKDQTFFLSQIPQNGLRHTMFPLGDLLKSEVRKVAEEEKLYRISKKKGSKGICFIGKRKFTNFISEYVDDVPGEAINFETGRYIGTHKGFHHYTLGQRFNLHLQTVAYYIYSKDTLTNTLYVVPGADHPCLYTFYVYLEEMVWINVPNYEFVNEEKVECEFRFQHGFPTVNGTFYRVPPEKYFKENVHFLKLVVPLRSLTPGQFGVMYKDGECLGSARINCIGETLYKDLRRKCATNY